ncbi:MAG: hypothetical protein PHT94_02645 [Candidatus Nanoarchaeia archaeon]|nr:hypothetical protein [Candidatus Nanoarchaeia archaeon]
MIDITLLFNVFSKALIILLSGFLISKIASMSLLKIFKEFNVDENINKILKLDINYSELFSKILEIIIIIIAFIYSINELNVLPIIAFIFSLGVILVFLILFTISISNYLTNFLSGIYFRKNITSNKIEINREVYNIVSKNIFDIEALDKNKIKHIIPYSYLSKHKIKLL